MSFSYSRLACGQIELQARVQQIVRYPEVRLLHPRKGLLQIQQPFVGSQLKHSNRTGQPNVAIGGCLAPTQLIDQEQIRLQFAGKTNGRELAGVETGDWFDCRRHPLKKPSWTRSDKVTYGLCTVRLLQFRAH